MQGFMKQPTGREEENIRTSVVHASNLLKNKYVYIEYACSKNFY